MTSAQRWYNVISALVIIAMALYFNGRINNLQMQITEHEQAQLASTPQPQVGEFAVDTPIAETSTPQHTGQDLPTATASAASTQTVRDSALETGNWTECKDTDQVVRYYLDGFDGKAGPECIDGKVMENEVKSVQFNVTEGPIYLTLERVGLDLHYAVSNGYSPDHLAISCTLTGTSLAPGHATVTVTDETLLRITDEEPVEMTCTVGSYTIFAVAEMTGE